MKDDGVGGGGGGKGSDEGVMKVVNDWILAVWGVLMMKGLTDICNCRVTTATENMTEDNRKFWKNLGFLF